jgi:hypothetical protein
LKSELFFLAYCLFDNAAVPAQNVIDVANEIILITVEFVVVSITAKVAAEFFIGAALITSPHSAQTFFHVIIS